MSGGTVPAPKTSWRRSSPSLEPSLTCPSPRRPTLSSPWMMKLTHKSLLMNFYYLAYLNKIIVCMFVDALTVMISFELNNFILLQDLKKAFCKIQMVIKVLFLRAFLRFLMISNFVTPQFLSRCQSKLKLVLIY